MLRIPAVRRPLAAAVLFGTACGLAGLTAPAAPARAQTPVTLNFNSVTAPGADFTSTPNCYRESGFQLTAVLANGTALSCTTADAFATTGPTTAMFLNDPNATLVDFTRVGGGLFSMQSIAFTPFVGASTSMTLIGSFLNGSTFSQTFNILGSLTGLQTFTLAPQFVNLRSVRLAALDAYGEPIVEFDNVTFTPAASTVPEPATIALVAGGLLGVGAAARRRTRVRTPQA